MFFSPTLLPKITLVSFLMMSSPAIHGPVSAADIPPPSLDPDFKLGISYYGAFSAGWSSTVSKDFAKIADAGYKVIRVWATWCGPNCAAGSLVKADGTIAQLNKLNGMLAFAKNRNIYLDITFEPAQFNKLVGSRPDYATYKQAIKNVAQGGRGCEGEWLGDHGHLQRVHRSRHQDRSGEHRNSSYRTDQADVQDRRS